MFSTWSSRKWLVMVCGIFTLSAVYLWSLTQRDPPQLPLLKIMSAHAQQKAISPPPSGLNSSLTGNTTLLHTLVTTTASAPTHKWQVTTQKVTTQKVTTQKNVNLSNHTQTPKLLCVYFRDRLGNQLFMYASTLGLALTMNRTAVFLNSGLLQRVLNNFTVSSAHLTFSQLRDRCARAKRIREKQICAFDQKLTQLDSRYDFTVGTWLQSYLYFHKYETKIRKAITFATHIQNQSKKIVQDLRQKHPGCTLIGVHIRHGDMAKRNNQKRGYPLASPDFINRSLSYFTQRFNSCVFVVGSDSLQWCRENFPKGYTLHFLAGHEPAVDMQTLVLTDHVVTSFGTFSWWIGFLNRGTTVYMKNFLIRRTQVRSYFSADAKDYIYPNWIPLRR